MKTIGLLGGMSWYSTLEYYRLINEAVNRRLGGLASARCVVYSLNFAEIEQQQARGEWDALAPHLIEAARRLEAGGADVLLICCNTAHRVADRVQEAIGIPLLHIADAVGARVRNAGLKSVALLGSRHTLADEDWRRRLGTSAAAVLRPSGEHARLVDRTIYYELCRGVIRDESRAALLDVVATLTDAGAQGIILGCTELGLLIRPDDVTVPLFDTTICHAAAAVDFALRED